jgi:hypothetical protein
LRTVAFALETASEWRRAIWRRWLLSQLSAERDLEAVTSGAQTAANSASEPPPKSDAQRAATEPQRAATEAAPAAESARVSEPPPPGDDDKRAETRRAEVRARFDTLCDRFLSVEASLDSMSRRVAVRDVHDRQATERIMELVERIADAAERQSAALASAAGRIERMERRLEQCERLFRSERAAESRESFRPPRDPRVPRTIAPRPREDDIGDDGGYDDAIAPSSFIDPLSGASSLSGNLGDLSLSTLLGMFELERRTGSLQLRADHGSMISFDLVDGVIVGTRGNEGAIEPVDAVRQALQWSSGRFWFRSGAVIGTGPTPRSIGSLLLEATRQNDEAIR